MLLNLALASDGHAKTKRGGDVAPNGRERRIYRVNVHAVAPKLVAACGEGHSPALVDPSAGICSAAPQVLGTFFVARHAHARLGDKKLAEQSRFHGVKALTKDSQCVFEKSLRDAGGEANMNTASELGPQTQTDRGTCLGGGL